VSNTSIKTIVFANVNSSAVTAVYKGTTKNDGSILLRSYDSRKEPAPEFNCTIWQAGRATCATGLAFKPIQIGHSVFIDEGAGNYNPAPQVLDEAAINEWPGREIGVFISIGTGKRPASSSAATHEWWEGFVGGGIGDFAEARRRLVSKIEGCEETHQYMRNEHLFKRQVNMENYYRLNVEVGVGDFGMNEWSRLADISTNTRRYLAKPEVRRINEEAAAKLAKIEIGKKRRQTNFATAGELNGYEKPSLYGIPPLLDPLAAELPGDEGKPMLSPRYTQQATAQEKFAVVVPDDTLSPVEETRFRRSADMPRYGDDPRISDSSIIPSPRRSNEGYIRSGRPWSNDYPQPLSPKPHEAFTRAEPPPLPPKMPIQYPVGPEPSQYVVSPRGNGAMPLPYPDNDGPPPVVNMARKPERIMRQ
jgi:hypothetical protein